MLYLDDESLGHIAADIADLVALVLHAIGEARGRRDARLRHLHRGDVRVIGRI
jgi:hypothetical protein